MTKKKWTPKKIMLKLGTLPGLIYIVDGRSKIEVGKRIRIRENTHRSVWHQAKIRRIEGLERIFADRV